MKIGSIILIALCGILMNIQISAQTPKELAEAWDKHHVSILSPKELKHIHLKLYMMNLKNLDLKVEEIGRSYENREIYRVEWGKGDLKILMWSQMHGNEPTATSALLDMLSFLQRNRNVEWIKKLEETVTIRAIPMLNPDGAEKYTRRNAQSIDINRDALALETPEGKILINQRFEWKPDIGFNLHNQNPWTTVGDTKKQAAISLLVVTGNAEGITNPGLERNKRLCGVMVNALNEFIKGHIGRYDESYNPLAFGDLFSAGGTPVILIETGGLQEKEDDPLFLVKMNFIAYLSALNALATGSEKDVSPNIYNAIPLNNSGNLFSVIFRNATIINFVIEDENTLGKSTSIQPFTADIALNTERRRTGEVASMIVRDIGDLSVYKGLKEFDVSEYYLVAKDSNLHLGSRSELLFYKKSREINWTQSDLTEKNKPDAIFSNGKWTKVLKK